MLPFLGAKAAVKQAPLGFSRLAAIGRMHQCQCVFGQVRGDARIDELDLAGLALEGGIQTTAEHVQVALVDHADRLLRAGKLSEKPVAVIELVDQRAAFSGDLSDFPLAATVEQRQVAFVPAPFLGQSLQQHVLPTGGTLACGAGELFVDLQIQAAPHQFQTLRFVPGVEVLFYASVHNHVRVQLVEVELVGEDRLFEAQTQTLPVRMFAGIDLDQQQFEHRLVRRLNAFKQLPQACANELPRWNVRHMTEVEHLFGPDEALGQQRVDVLAVPLFVVDRHQPP